VITGADRIAANGDVDIRIGTYPLALAARANGVPFYVAAPVSTIDPTTPNGEAVPIEACDQAELLHVEGVDKAGVPRRVRMTPWGSSAVNPAFDVTPAEPATGIITERGVIAASRAGISGVLSAGR